MNEPTEAADTISPLERRDAMNEMWPSPVDRQILVAVRETKHGPSDQVGFADVNKFSVAPGNE